MNHIELGQKGEMLAAEFLIRSGHEIMAKNWKARKAEIDLITKDGDTLVFVEVKTKSYTYYGSPEEQVDTKKERLIISAASQYMDSIQYDWKIRFDIISIVFRSEEDFDLRHYPDAFFPGV